MVVKILLFLFAATRAIIFAMQANLANYNEIIGYSLGALIISALLFKLYSITEIRMFPVPNDKTILKPNSAVVAAIIIILLGLIQGVPIVLYLINSAAKQFKILKSIRIMILVGITIFINAVGSYLSFINSF